ncbi:MAG: hypothetical protein AAB669_00440 [Patescibacteria group bacterium]
MRNLEPKNLRFHGGKVRDLDSELRNGFARFELNPNATDPKLVVARRTVTASYKLESPADIADPSLSLPGGRFHPLGNVGVSA